MSARADLINRELSWLEFNSRVLEEAADATVPLLERLRFLAIFSSNLDEFFMVRVAGLWRQAEAGVATAGPDGRSPREVIRAVSRRAHELVAEQHRILLEDILPALGREKIFLKRRGTWTADQESWLRNWFLQNALPVITPIAIDPGHPFPHIANRALCLMLELEALDEDDDLAPAETCIVHIPAAVLPRFLVLPSPSGELHVTLLEDAVRQHLDLLFRRAKVLRAGAIRVSRDAELDLDEDQADDLLRTIEVALRNRRLGAAIRLQYEPEVSAAQLAHLTQELELDPDDLYEARGFTAFADLGQLYALVDRPNLKFKPWVPAAVPRFTRTLDMFAAIDAGDVLVHHPYQTFDHVVRFLDAASQDPDVLAIKITLYRMSRDSRIAQALLNAAQNGKTVAALVELRARFNEESNIAWARRLETAGAHVVYGVTGFKTHAKAAMVVRRVPGGLRRYVHLSTGNYNEANAQSYGDFSLFTSKPAIGEDVSWLFNMLTGYARPDAFQELLVAPLHLKAELTRRIRREVDHAEAGRPARIVVKLNALVDPDLIQELYRASQAGVPIQLLIRGVCCLRPGVPGLSDTITAVRIVDRFLEHARLFRFENGGEPEMWLSSADWMPRNLSGRVEVAFPVHDSRARRELDAYLTLQLADNVKASRILPDGRNERIPTVGEPVRSQEVSMKRARRR